jgi:hypothetical protein
MDFSKLRHLSNQMPNTSNKSTGGHHHLNKNYFFTKIVRLKFDLKMCSVKEFTELLKNIDNCAIKYIQKTNKCRIMIREVDHLSLANFMGEITATLESASQNNLIKTEKSLKQLADAVHYRLAKCLSSHCNSDPSIVGSSSFNYVNVLVQSPTSSVVSTPNDSCVSDLSLPLTSNNCSNMSISAKLLLNDSLSMNNTLNNDLLNMSTDTPKTSSPISSSGESSLRRFKQTKKIKHKQPKVESKTELTNSSSAFENFVKAVFQQQHQQRTVEQKLKALAKQEKNALKKEKAALKKQEKMAGALKQLIGIPTTTTTKTPTTPTKKHQSRQQKNQMSLNKQFELINLNTNLCC